MKILRIICSPRRTASESYRLSQHIVQAIAAQAGQAVDVLDIDANGLPHVDGDYAAELGARHGLAEPPRHGSTLRSDELIRRLDAADCIVIATPMHNFTVPSSLKTWIDHVVRVRATFQATADGKTGTLRDRPVFVAVASGGRFSGDGARQPDFLTGYLTAVLATMGLKTIKFFSVEGTVREAAAVEAARAGALREIAAFFGADP